MSKYSIGIDLGTTNTALSYLDLSQSGSRPAAESVLEVPQLTAPGTLENKGLLPSFLYLPAPEEFPAAALALPWEKGNRQIVGEFARAHGGKVPMRLVASAKSWLCHPGVDRKSALLPWQAPPEIPKVSPLDASAVYLRYLANAWKTKFKGDGQADLAEQQIILTVPASFDAGARELTLEAARQAGLENVILLEEPQAALYAWIEAQGESFRKHLRVGDVILVVDVGGGTTDLSLIAVTEEKGDLQLTRLAVGDHILLGGDNMDLALGHTLNQALQEAGKKLDAWQFSSLTYACREAKERLFSEPKLKAVPISIASRGSALIGGTIKTELTRADLERILANGFFPETKVTEAPQTARRSGFDQIGLPYAQDPAVTRHIAAFLTRQTEALLHSKDVPATVSGKQFIHPTAILFNGGVFKAAPLKSRVMEVLNSWLERDGGAPLRELEGADLDLAVARGAAYYGWVRSGHGVRIRGGTAHAYYVGIESAVPAVPGFEPPVKALCVAPFGMEEGTEADVPPQEFGLFVGEPTQFRFFSSSTRREDLPGTMLDDASHNEELEEVAPIETSLPAGKSEPGKLIPVNLQAAVSELGLLELRCIEKNGPGRWKLELNVRMKE
jgi:hypothetical protein